MNLRDHMEDAVGTTTTDLGRLSQDSRRQGLKLRRYRQAISGVGAAAGVAVVLTTVHLVTGGSSVGSTGGHAKVDTPVAATLTPSAEPSQEPAPTTVRLTGRSTVAALRAAVGTTTAGTFGGYAGQADHDTYGELVLTPADRTGVGVVGVNVQHGSILDGQAFDCSTTWMVDCQVRTLDNGDRLRTYQDQPVASTQGTGLRVVAELLTRDRSLRVLASATNGFDLGADEWDVTRPDPVLDVAQLSRIVSQPWWGFQVPRRFETAGEALTPYTDLDGGLD